MRDVRDVWVCELPECGGAWLAKTDVAPDKCGKCRKRGWHLTKTTKELIREKAPDLDDQVRRIVREEMAKIQAGSNVARNVPAQRHSVPPPKDTRVVVDEYSEGYIPPAPPPRYAPPLNITPSPAPPSPPLSQPQTPAAKLAAINAQLSRVADPGRLATASALLDPDEDDVPF